MKKLLLFLLSLSFYFAQAQYPEGFESGVPPTGWARFDNGVGTLQSWTNNGTFPNSGTQAAFVQREAIGTGNTSEDWLVTPLSAIPANGQLRFFTRQLFSGDGGTLYDIRVSTTSQTNPATFTSIQTYTETQLNENSVYNVYEEKVLDISAFATQSVYIAFVRVHTQTGATVGGDGWFIDDVNVTQQCFDPFFVQVSNITGSTVQIAWTETGSATQWEIIVLPAGSPAPTSSSTGTVVNTNPYTFTGLNPGTQYEIYVRSRCSSTNFSDWTGPVLFATVPAGTDCTAPVQVTALPYLVSANTATYGNDITGPQGAGCVGGSTNYLAGNEVFYSYTATFNGSISITSTPTQVNSSLFVYASCANVGVNCLAGVANNTNAPREITGFAVTAGTTYYIVISSTSATPSVDYTLLIQQENCPKPTGLGANNIGTTTADLSWNEPGTATSWEIVVQTAGTGIPTGSGVTTGTNTNYPATGLTAATQYEYWVRSDCGDGTFSAWAGPFYFNTSVCESSEKCGYVFRMTDSGSNGWQGNTMDIRQGGITVATIGSTFTAGAGPVDVVVLLCNNVPFELFWNAGGTSPTQVGVSVIEPTASAVVYNKPAGTGSQNTLLYTGLAQCTPPTCQQPTNVLASGANSSSVQVSWTDNAGATQWEVIVQPAGTGYPTGTGTIVSTNPYTVTGLTSNTPYEVWVRAICSASDSSAWSGPSNFATTANYCAGDHFYDTGGPSGNYNNSANNIVTICPETPGDQVTVNFLSFALENNFDFLTIYDGPTTASPALGTFTGNNTPPEFTSSDPSGCLTFSFTSDSSVTAAGWEATILCAPPPTCPKPINVATTGITTGQATISWIEAGTATQWEIIILPAGSPAPTATDTGIITSSNPYVATGLSTFTSYDVYVRAICVPGVDVSFWSVVNTFTTLPDYCAGDHFYDTGGPSGNYNNSANNVVTICPDTPGDVVVVLFNSFALENNFDFLSVYDGPNTSSALLGTFTGTALPPQMISSVTNGGCLTFQFTSDGSVTSAGWDATILCTVPPACTQPTNLTVTNISSDSAVLSWTDTNTPPSSSWQIVVQPAGSGYPNGSSTVINVTTNPYTVTGLTPSTQYEYYVLSDCGATDGLSFWSGPVRFNTLFPGCGGSQPAGNECVTAAPVCSLDGYCGNTSGTYTVNTWTALSNAFCGSIENNSFLTFEAASTSISMNVNVGNCTNGSGIQFMMFSTTACGSGPVTEIDCFSPMNPGINTLNFNGLVPGQTYYLMIDGFAGAVCDYTVTVTSGGSTTTDVDITQDNQTICIDDTLTLNAIGGNGVFNWSPATGLSATTGANVTFTPPAPGTYTITVESTDTNSLCATSDFVVVTVLDITNPSFTNPGSICQGSPNVPLDNTDVNGITGEWHLGSNIGPVVTEVDASTVGTFDYIFVPNVASFPCSPEFSMTVEILGTCTFNAFATAVNINTCETTAPGEFFNITGSGTNAIGPATNVFPNNNYGTYVQNSGNLIFNGAELKSFKTVTSNVCSANLYYRVYEASSTPGTFTTVALPFFDDCVAGSFPTGGPCNTGDQKWQDVAQAIDLTQNAPGDYVIELYFDLIGDNNDPSQCDDTILVNNNGNNFHATFTIQAVPTFTVQDEECGSSNGSITFSGFNPGDVYAVSYSDDTIPVGPTNYTADFNGDIIITGLDAGTYTNFIFVINGCTIAVPDTITVIDYSPSVTSLTVVNSEICFGSNAEFVIVGTPGFDVDLTVNGTPDTVTIPASGSVTYTVTTPAVGNVDVVLVNIHNAVCNVVVTFNATVIVNPLPTVTIAAPSPYACYVDPDPSDSVPGDGTAVFQFTGTPNTVVTFTGAPGSPITLDATGNYTLNVVSTTNVQITIVDITNPTTGCTNIISGQVANVAIVDVPEVTTNITQPTCASPTGTITITGPTTSQLNYPGDLFISEVTDATSANLNYVEIYNGTGNPVDLSNYKLRVEATNATCELTLTGILANDAVFVVKCGSGAPIAGVPYDMIFTGCSASVNNDDRYLLTNLAGVVIDRWGNDFLTNLPQGGGYDFRRLPTGTTLPTINWDIADWNAIDWTSNANSDYSDVGIYTLFVDSYEYVLSDGTNTTTYTTSTISNVAPGTYTIVVHDTITGCDSDPTQIVIDTPPGATDPNFTQIGPLCQNSTAPTLPLTSPTGVTGIWSPASIDTSVTGIVTYTFTPDGAVCSYAVTMDIEVLDSFTPTFTQIGPLCQNSTAPSLPTTSDNGVVGTWSPASIDTSSSGTYTYTFTSNSTCDVVVTMDIVITPQVTPTFTQIGTLCQNSTAPVLPTTSDNGVVGVWSPATIDTSVLGTVTYTFTPSTTCDVTVTMDVTIASETLPTFAITSTYCQNEVASALPTTSDNGIVGTWLPASIDTSVSGVTTYEFTPNAGQCASSYTLTVSVDPTQSISFDGVDVCSGSVVDFPTVTAEGYTLTGTWSPSVITTTTSSTYTFTPSDSCYGVGTFEIVVNGCTIPKGFSPNGDGNNDTWDLSSFNIKKVEVFNRYGLKVYSKRNYVNEWGGKSDNGDELPTGTYYYMIDFEDRPSVTGWVYINRGE